MTPENRNLILAVVLSMVVLFGWQIMVIQPEIEKEQAQQALLAEQQAAKKSLRSTKDVGTPVVDASGGAEAKLDVGVQNEIPIDIAKRVTIDAPLVQGSFSLQGARIDDIVLTGYHETLDAGSENIRFLRKVSSPSPFFAEFGWASSDADQPMPNAQTVWAANSDLLSPSSPVNFTLTLASSPGWYFVLDGLTLTFNIRFSGGTQMERSSLYSCPSAMVQTSMKQFGISPFSTSNS